MIIALADCNNKIICKVVNTTTGAFPQNKRSYVVVKYAKLLNEFHFLPTPLP